ncbi:glycosyltransferase family 4 protein [Gloeocapsa sp. BRSZ]
MKTILVATDRKFWRQEQGSAKRISDLHQYLTRKNFKVFVFFIGKLTKNDINLIQTTYNESFIVINGNRCININCDTTAINYFQRLKLLLKKKAKRLKDFLLRLTQKRKYSIRNLETSDFFNREWQEYFRSICRQINPDVIIVEYIRLAYLIQDFHKFIPNRPLTIIDTHDVAHQRYQTFQAHGEQEIKITEEEEKQLLSLFDVVLAIQGKDKQVFKKMLPKQKVIQAGYACDVKFHDFSSKPPVNITYVGGPNVSNKRAIAHFITNVWEPLSVKFQRNVKLNLVGRICETLSELKLPNNVKKIGWAEDLNRVYQEADIAINPVYFGTGLKIKNVEALCNGKPLVTTTIGAEGLEHGINDAFFVSDKPEEMIEQLSSLIEDQELRRQVAKKAYNFACENFGEERVYQELYQVLTAPVTQENIVALDIRE